MDNVTHGLLGIAIGMLRPRDGGKENDRPLSQTDKAVALATFAAAELPDVDIFFGSGPMDGLRYHRGWTHALIAAPALALLASAVAKLIWREARFRTVYAWSLAAIFVAHLVNDWLTGWGTRLLLPWSEARLGLDWIPIVDLLYTVPLLIAVIRAWRRPAARTRTAATVLIYLVVYCLAFRGIPHTLVQRAVVRGYEGRPVTQMRVSPDLFNPLQWRYTVDLGDRYETGLAYPWSLGSPATVSKGPDDAVTRAVRQAPELQPFFAQFGFPVLAYEKAGDGYQVTLGDVRYQASGRGMQYVARLNADLTVAEVLESGW